MKKLKQSETIIIKRTQINLNPFNPKNHSDKQIKNQLNNLKKVGFNGGVKWNAITGNLIDGHRRVKAMDLFYKYDGSLETDYNIKVEKVEFDVKTEKEQLTYEALGNTKADYNLVADYANDIDFENIGLTDDDVKVISSLIEVNANISVEIFDDMITPKILTPEEKEEKKQKVKEMKQKIKDDAQERNKNENAYITLSFSNHEIKEAFCELIGIDPNDRFVKGEKIMEIIE